MNSSIFGRMPWPEMVLSTAAVVATMATVTAFRLASTPSPEAPNNKDAANSHRSRHRTNNRNSNPGRHFSQLATAATTAPSRSSSMPPFLTPATTRCDALRQEDTASHPPFLSSDFERMPLPARGVLETHAVFGLLHDDDLIEQYDIYRNTDPNDATAVVGVVQFGKRLDGHPGIVHGGILGLVLDDIFGFGFFALGVRMAVTANLNIDYRAPVPAGSQVKVTVQLEQREGRKLHWKARIESVDGSVLYTEATSLYIIPKKYA
uniref:Acyl-coenzyme A thioesterase THEM4 n=1 Tax=Craspedostauros australis TaxID=1486917 RepID=A0A7R9ZHY4_9STRA|eukprot:CAMPEP_0198110692 /NCGR_PEP_ID=MMETSP1442-20131203/2702_1 /TAXON_ID= /ORGANISM="Craspedostauros australis, Strain CCMP3328" /LENGTH=262 /DNA_ID=CAMNT_0043766855 /DNA_START=83 /DNA_END=871 /DNA_ORIENTATION=+